MLNSKEKLSLNRIGLLIDQRYKKNLPEKLQDWFERHEIITTIIDWNVPETTDFDLVVALGGDGTVLFALGHYDCPVLAINYGNIGFLTAGNREELTKILQRVLDKDYIISDRSMIRCDYPSGTIHAVNEVVLKGATHLINVDLSIDGNPIRQIRGDGVIVGTATGSTAYLLSAGSPIVMPEMRCMILAGLNEYNFTARHLVVTPESEICLEIKHTHETDIYLSADGKEKIPLSIGDQIVIRESSRRARLVFMDNNYFFNNLSSRLSW